MLKRMKNSGHVYNLIEKRFSVNIAKFLRSPFLKTSAKKKFFTGLCIQIDHHVKLLNFRDFLDFFGDVLVPFSFIARKVKLDLDFC